MPDNDEVIQAIIEKRHADVKLISAKQMARILEKEIPYHPNLVRDPFPDDSSNLQVYLGTIRQIRTIRKIMPVGY